VRRLVLALALALASTAAALAPTAPGAPAADPRCPPSDDPPPEKQRPITRPQWLARTVITEYFPASESWFRGKLVHAPGLAGKHRVDWLYSSSGLAMEGDGVGLDGRRYHFAGPYGMGWVTLGGRSTVPCPDGSWTRGWPAWLSFGWRTPSGGITYPLHSGGWAHGAPQRYVPAPADLRFGEGPSLPLVYWRSAATDTRLIPRGSRIFIPVYCETPARGWFVAQDTGGAIIGRHIDVYRTAPPASEDGRMFRDQRVYVVPAGTTPARPPSCERQGRGRGR
jgi:hypothetical protein